MLGRPARSARRRPRSRRRAPDRRRRLGPPAAAPQPGRDEHRPARLGARPRRRPRPRLVRLPEPAVPRARADAARARRAVLRRGACRRRPRRRARGGGGVVARPCAHTGRLAGITGAVGVAVATTHVAYSRMAVTDVLLTLGVTVTLALLVSGRLEWAGVAAGLAASAKYPGAVAGRAARRRRDRGVAACRSRASGSRRRRSCVTSPFVVVHAGAAWGDFHRVQRARPARMARVRGRSGDAARVRPAALGDDRAARRSSRPVGARRRACAVASGAISCSSRSRLPTRSRCSRSEAHFDRYVLPLVPVLAVLAGRRTPIAVAALVALRSSRSGGRSATPARSPVATRASTPPRGSTGTCRAATSSPPTRRRCHSRADASSGSSCRGPGAPSTRAATSRCCAPRALGGSWSAGASPTACSPLPPTTRARPRFYRALEPWPRRVRDAASSPGGATPVARGLPHLPLSGWSAAEAGVEGLAVSTAVFLSGAVLLGVEIAASRVLAPTFGSSLYVWGALIGVVLTGLAIGYWVGGVLADRWPSPYLFVGAIALGRGARARDPGRRRLGARAGRHVGPRPAARPACRGDRALRPDERRAGVRLADRRQARRALDRPAGPHGRAAVRDLDRRQHRRDLRDLVLARPRVRHRPGARGRRGRRCSPPPAPSPLARAALAARAPGSSPRPAPPSLAVGAARARDDRHGARAAPRPGTGRLSTASGTSRRRGSSTRPRSALGGRGLHRPRGPGHALPPPARRRGRRRRATSASTARSRAACTSNDPFRTRFAYSDYLELGLAYNPSATKILVIGLGGAAVQKRLWRDFRDVGRDDGRARPRRRRRRVPWFAPAARPAAAPGRGRRRPAVPPAHRRALRRDHGRRLLLRRRPLPHDDARVRPR